MVSIISIISLFVLLFTYSYSLPVVQQQSVSTPPNKCQPGQMTCVPGKPVDVKPTPDSSMTNVDDVESTTLSKRGVGRFDDDDDITTPSKRLVEQPDVDVTTPSKRAVEQVDREFTTPESSTLSKRAVKQEDDEDFTTQETTTVSKRSLRESDSSEEFTIPRRIRVLKRTVEQVDREITTPESTTLSKRAVEQDDDKDFTTQETTTVSKRSVKEPDSSEEFTTPKSTKVLKRAVEQEDDKDFTTQESTTVSKRSVKEPDSSEEFTTSRSVEFTPRSVVDGSDFVFTSSVVPQRFGQFPTPPIESSTQFNRRAINAFQPEEGVQQPTPFFLQQKQNVVIQDTQPSSSVTSFAKSTGFLNNVQSTKPGKEQVSQPLEPDSDPTIPSQEQDKEKRGIPKGSKDRKPGASTSVKI